MPRTRETSSTGGARRGRRGAERARPRKYTRVNSEVVDYMAAITREAGLNARYRVTDDMVELVS